MIKKYKNFLYFGTETNLTCHPNFTVTWATYQPQTQNTQKNYTLKLCFIFQDECRPNPDHAIK